MTELTDFAKVWFSHVAECFDPATGEKVEDDNPQTIWRKALASRAGATVLVGFKVTKPENLSWPEILTSLKGQGYTRLLAPSAPAAGAGQPARRGRRADPVPAAAAAPSAALSVLRIEDLLALPSNRLPLGAAAVWVVQDRLRLVAEIQPRFLEAVEAALHFGQGEVFLFGEADGGAFAECGHFSRGLHSPRTGRTFRPATPGLFSFNSPLGACPKCRGFGRVIDIDYRLAIPDHSVSIADGAIRPWEGEVYGESKKDLLQFARKVGLPVNVPFAALTDEQKSFVIDGSPGYDGESKHWPQYWYGLKGFFRYLEKTTYKMHVRVFLSRYRAYNPCPECNGTRLQPEALCWKWQGRTLPQLYQLPVADFLALLRKEGFQLSHPRLQASAGGTPARANAPGSEVTAPPGAGSGAHSATLAYDSIVTRLRYLEQVGLGYLTLDRSSRTLSGGEVERVNLTSCLGTSLVDTLFVLDEPSVGLHPRDIDRLVGIIRTLTDAGNTVVVVEHDEAMIRAADHVIEVGPEPGARGGHIVFQGDVAAMLASPASLTGRYLSGREQVELPARRRPVGRRAVTARRPRDEGSPSPALHFTNCSKHNIRNVTFQLPLRRFVCLSGVSGSGKSTLLDNVIHQGLLAQRGQMTEDPASIERIERDLPLAEIVLVDQSPLSRTPRSNPALYCEAWDLIRELYALTPAAQEAGLSASSFSFNSGDGRCDHCQGLGSERVEMQFLSDVFVPCPICEGRRFKPEVLAVQWNGRSVSDLLGTTVADAVALFADHAAIRSRLASLEAVGLGYLPLGQPLNTLSGGESQRLKLVRYLSDYTGGAVPPDREEAGADPAPALANPESQTAGALLLLDEPTTGLHRHDVRRLLEVLQKIVDRGHSLVVIEHNLDVLKSADWLIEMGPEAGAEGGQVVAAGTPEQIAAADTATSPFLRAALAADETGAPAAFRAVAEAAAPYGAALDTGLTPGSLVVQGARENNLKNVSVTIPHRRLSVVTGVSGSGKSTLAFDIVFAEGQRRFMESMSPYARQFVEQLPRPDIDRLTGIPPTVAIEQRVTRGSRKSTVATITEVAQYLRLLYARLGIQHHPDTGRAVTPLSPAQLRQLLERTLRKPAARRAKHLYLCAPLVRGRKGHHEPIAKWIARQGFPLMRADGRLFRPEAFTKLDRYKEHDVEAVVADLKRAEPRAVADALAAALRLGKGSCFLLAADGSILSWFSTTRTDIETGESFPELDPKQFSFNSPRGWCPTCRGHGRVYDWMLKPADEEQEMSEEVADALRTFDPDEPVADGRLCPTCQGERLNRIARAVRLPLRAARETRSAGLRRRVARAGTPGAAMSGSISLPELLRLTAGELIGTLHRLELDARGRLVTQDIVPQIEERLKFLAHVGLDYLSLDRPTETLSGGEAQRIRLAAQLGSNLSGVLYVLDEPSIGLHARDNDRLTDTLASLRDKGNTLLVVEHDEVVMERADRIIDLGPGAGVHGGTILANDPPADIKANAASLTGLFLAKGIPHPLRGSYREIDAAAGGRRGAVRGVKPGRLRRLLRLARGERAPEATGPAAPGGFLELRGISFRNLQDQDLRLPLGRLVMACGPSGAGKSTLFRDVLHPAVMTAIKQRKGRLAGSDFVRLGGFASDGAAAATRRGRGRPPFAELRNADGFRSVIEVDQSPIGKTPRSTPATYLGIFDLIRQFFASLPESKMRGYTASRFSFNVPGGRCETCAGAGRIRLEMAFMADSYLPCDGCGGTRFGAELADIAWKGKSIGDVLKLSFDEAAVFFDFHSQLSQVCQLMVDCGLGYLTLGQSSPTLSGGEAQRLKLVTELTRGLASYQERSRGIAVRNLYLLEEPTIGLHLSDCEKLIKVLHNLVDQGHTVVVIEHHLDLLAEADWILELGPGGGPHGGQILYQGPLPGLLRLKDSPTAPYLRAKLKTSP
ncbi:MAG TPA: excinuclease ABC subunit UvrA [Opitutaceae bacterium]|nr:excinuclease ABC subunit UvrA [Opitutaceae bacterium]